MKNEAAFWSNWVRPLLHSPRHGHRAWKIPAETRTGLPDVNYGGIYGTGWLELKYDPTWPKRGTTPIVVAVTPEQYAHLREEWECGGSAYCLYGCADEWFLLGFPQLKAMWSLTRLELQQVARARGVMRKDDQLLLAALASSTA